jgi:hypothetical protein
VGTEFYGNTLSSVCRVCNYSKLANKATCIYCGNLFQNVAGTYLTYQDEEYSNTGHSFKMGQ